jgi:hypothetical protein
LEELAPRSHSHRRSKRRRCLCPNRLLPRFAGLDQPGAGIAVTDRFNDGIGASRKREASTQFLLATPRIAAWLERMAARPGVAPLGGYRRPA